MGRIIIRALAAITAAMCLLAPSGYAKEPVGDTNPYTAPAQPNEADLKENGHYTNKRGEVVHSPAHSKSGAVPKGASARCRDGSYSFSRSHRGTCSHHGGVDSWL